MNFKQIGDYLEIECCGCGEPLLIGDGDCVNVRVGVAEMDGEEIPMPEGFLCVVCHRMEGKKDESFVRMKRKKCSDCGKTCESDNDNFFPKFDSENNFRGFFCEDCF